MPLLKMISHGGIQPGKLKIRGIEKIMPWVWGVFAICVQDIIYVHNRVNKYRGVKYKCTQAFASYKPGLTTDKQETNLK